MKHLLIFLTAITCYGQVVIQSGTIQNASFTVVAAGGGGSCETVKDTYTGTTSEVVNCGNDEFRRYVAGYILTGAESYQACKVVLRMNKTGSPSGTLTVEIRADSSGEPGVVVANGTSAAVNASSLGASEGDVTFTFSTPPSISPATVYWVSVTSSAIDPVNYCGWAGVGSGTSPPLMSADNDLSGWSWAATYTQAKLTLYAQ